jgi:NAD-dependent dihydropyrimidine dehydrogenase PreA subunit
MHFPVAFRRSPGYYIAFFAPTHFAEGGTSGMIMVTVDKAKCDGDGTCVNVCPQAVFKLEGGKAEPVNMSECINCQTCVENCPQQAITVTEL